MTNCRTKAALTLRSPEAGRRSVHDVRAGQGWPAAPMDLTVQDAAGGVTRVFACGEFDLTTRGAFGDVLFGASADFGVRCVALDCAGVRFIDASTIGLLLEVQALLRARGATLRLERPSDIVQRVLTITHLASAFDDQSSP
jgi:anti-anti-sigma factor